MTKTAPAFTREKNSTHAAEDLSDQIKKELLEKVPQVLILFAAPSFEQEVLLKNLRKELPETMIVGCSSAGEFTSSEIGVDGASAIAIYSNEMQFNAGVGKGISTDREETVDQLIDVLQGRENFKYKYHTCLVLADALSGYTNDIVDLLTERTAGTYQFFGGGAGDNANFKKTSVFFNEEVLDDAVVMLEILSNKPLGMGVSHGWQPEEELFRVTDSDGLVLKSLNAIPAVEVFQDFAKKRGVKLDPKDPIPFFLHNILGIKTENGFKLRFPLSVNADGSLVCASDIPTGSLVSIMTTQPLNSINAAGSAMQTAVSLLDGNEPEAALFFDCVATRLRLGKVFDSEIDKVKSTFPGKKLVGCNTHGQVARMDGQFSGFHNCTTVVCIIPQ